MAQTSKLNATFDFGDGREQFNYAVEPYAANADAVTNFKAKCIEFNNSTETSIATTKANMMSNGGYTCTGIKAAYIETTERTDFVLNG